MEVQIFEYLVEWFGPKFALIVVITLAIIAIFRFGLKFDLNKYFDSKKKKHLKLARLECPHMTFLKTDEGVVAESLFVSPYGTLSYQCKQCGLVVDYLPSDEEFKRIAESFVKDPDAYDKRMKRFMKYMKKSF